MPTALTAPVAAALTEAKMGGCAATPMVATDATEGGDDAVGQAMTAGAPAARRSARRRAARCVVPRRAARH
jgi:hypothetical protein